MRKYLVYLLCFSVLLLACDSASEPAQSEPDAGPTNDAPESPGISGVGASPSCDEAQCREEADGLVSYFGASTVAAHTYVGGHCDMVSIVGVPNPSSGMACFCETGSTGFSLVGPKGAGCFALGRAGDCIWSDTDYEPCTKDNDDCAERCEELEARYAADAQRTFDAEVRSSTCDEAGYCHYVLRIEDACFADRSFQNGRSYDCSLSDTEIAAQEVEARTPKPPVKCSELPPEGGTCVSDEPAVRECVKRPEGEWQGIPVCGPYPPCTRSDRCGAALACIDGKCQACTQDEQCAEGEGCVLDHCVREENITCHVRADCKEGELCLLSGLTGGTPRSNEDTRSYCQGLSGGAAMKP